MQGEAKRVYKTRPTISQKMKRLFKATTAALFIVSALGIINPTAANAWVTSQSASAACESNQAVISWSFKSEYPRGYPIPGTNRESATIKMTVTDARTGTTHGTYTVAPQQTISKTINTGVNKIPASQLDIHMEYAYWNMKAMRDTVTISVGDKKFTPDEYGQEYGLTANQVKNKFAVDSRVAVYNATERCIVPHTTPTDFNPVLVCQLDSEGAAQYRLKIRSVSGSDASFSPVHNSFHSTGNAIDVTATYDDGPYGTKTVTKTTNTAEDCTPPAPEVSAVCTNLKRISVTDTEVTYEAIAEVENADIRAYKFLVNNKLVQESDSPSFTFDNTTPGTYDISAEVVIASNGDQMVVTSKACSDTVTVNGEQMCTVAGKETLTADDPNCKETVKPATKTKMCTIEGKTNLEADDPNCRAATLPNTGPMSALMSFIGSGALATTVRSWYLSKRTLRNAQTR